MVETCSSQPASLHRWPLSPQEVARDVQNHRFGVVLPHTQLSNKPSGSEEALKTTWSTD
ncbi:hypothetical protein ACRRTK_009635 [Alexandromys fortis]